MLLPAASWAIAWPVSLFYDFMLRQAMVWERNLYSDWSGLHCSLKHRLDTIQVVCLRWSSG